MYKLKIEEEIVCDIINGFECAEKFKSDMFVFDNFFKIVNEQKVFPYVYDYLKKTLKGENLQIIEKEAQRLKIKNLITLHQMDIITRAFQKENISFAFSKGLVSAFYTCDNPLLRDMNDIDIVINPQDFISGCKLLERLGYNESFYNDLCESKLLICSKDEYYSINSSQCTFEKENMLSIELKDKIQYIEKEPIVNWILKSKKISICNVDIPIFEKKSIFKNIIVNSFKNLCSPYGIEHDYRIKDIVEPYFYIIKNLDIFNDNYVEELTNEFGFKLVAVFGVIREFFTRDNFEKLPKAFQRLKAMEYNQDFMEWEDIHVFERLFDRIKRLSKHSLFRYNNYTNMEKQVVKFSETKEWRQVNQASNEVFFKKVFFKLNKNSGKINISFMLDKNLLENEIIINFRIANTKDEKNVYEEISISMKGIQIKCCNCQKINIKYKKLKHYMLLILEFMQDEFEFTKERSLFFYFNVSACFSDQRSIQICSEGDIYFFTKYVINN